MEPLARVCRLDVHASCQLSVDTAMQLGSGVRWTGQPHGQPHGQPQLDFDAYHRQVLLRVEELHRLYMAQPKSAILVTNIEPVWQEPKMAPEFYVCKAGEDCLHTPQLAEQVFATSLPAQQVVQVRAMARTIFPAGMERAALPANFSLSFTGRRAQSFWTRTLAWQIRGYVADPGQKKLPLKNNGTPFNATVLSVLPSGALDAVAGAIDVCALPHDGPSGGRIAIVKSHFCS